jgi:hypothetical protein
MKSGVKTTQNNPSIMGKDAIFPIFRCQNQKFLHFSTRDIILK